MHFLTQPFLEHFFLKRDSNTFFGSIAPSQFFFLTILSGLFNLKLRGKELLFCLFAEKEAKFGTEVVRVKGGFRLPKISAFAKGLRSILLSKILRWPKERLEVKFCESKEPEEFEVLL
jgi:hypothetical protein